MGMMKQAQQMQKEMLKANQYIHKLGLWKDYCEWIKENNK